MPSSSNSASWGGPTGRSRSNPDGLTRPMVSSPGGGAGPDGHRYPRNAGPCGDRCSAARNLHDPNRHDRRDRSSPDGCREPCAPGWQPDRTDDRTTGGRSRKTAGAPQGGSAQRSARRGSLGRTGLRDRARLRDGRRCSTVSRAGASAGGRHRATEDTSARSMQRHGHVFTKCLSRFELTATSTSARRPAGSCRHPEDLRAREDGPSGPSPGPAPPESGSAAA
jgi:hypothetical protein